MRNINKDRFGAIAQTDGNGVLTGGDSTFFMGHYVYHEKISKKEWDYAFFFEESFGGYVRHPDPDNYMLAKLPKTDKFWGAVYRNPWRGCMSRDQMTGILAGLIAQKDYLAMLRLILNWACRLFFFANNSIPTPGDWKNQTDTPWQPPNFTGPNMWQMALRGFGLFSWIFWPLLCILDIHIFIDVLVNNKQDDEDQNNFFTRLHVASKIVPTPLSLLALRLLNKEKLKKDLEKYYTGWRQQPGMYDIMAREIEEM